MPNTSTVVAKSFAALIATGLGVVGGYNYVTGGNVFGTGNDYQMLPPPTSISAVSSAYTPYRPGMESTPSDDISAETPSTDDAPAEPTASCCLAPGRAGFLAPMTAETSTESQAEPTAEQNPPADNN